MKLSAILTTTSIVAAALFSAVNTYPLIGPRRGCATRDFNLKHDMKHENMLANMLLDSDSPVTSIHIPVLFHVIHNVANVTTDDNQLIQDLDWAAVDSKNGLLSAESIQKQIDVLNADYASSNVVFSLQGVNYVYNEKWFAGIAYGSSIETSMKSKYRQGSATTLNVYTSVLKGGLLGWATFPQDYQDRPEMDGVVVLYSSLPGGSAAPYNLGRTLTHEVGHWLGLYHTFQGGCSFPNDFVEDTRAESDPKFNCYDKLEIITTCNRTDFPEPSYPQYDAMNVLLPNDPTWNFMNYVNDGCMDEFTTGQAARIMAHWTMRVNMDGNHVNSEAARPF